MGRRPHGYLEQLEYLKSLSQISNNYLSLLPGDFLSNQSHVSHLIKCQQMLWSNGNLDTFNRKEWFGTGTVLKYEVKSYAKILILIFQSTFSLSFTQFWPINSLDMPNRCLSVAIMEYLYLLIRIIITIISTFLTFNDVLGNLYPFWEIYNLLYVAHNNQRYRFPHCILHFLKTKNYQH